MDTIPQNFTNKRCLPCEGLGAPLSTAKVNEYLNAVPGWQLAPGSKTISRAYVMKNFTAATRFVLQLAGVAEAENHHPDIHLTDYRHLKIELSTHAIGGLSENDFIVAAKINKLSPELKA